MLKTGKRIPIKDAREIGKKHGYTQVIVVAWDGDSGITSVCTWGKSLKECKEAAEGGNFVKKALGWPDELCEIKPKRKKHIKDNLEYLKGFCDGYGGEEPHDNFPEGFNDINEVWDRVNELIRKRNIK